MRTCLDGARTGIVLWAALLLGVWNGAGPTAAMALEVGDRAPDFTLPSTTGDNISLSQFRGKKLVLLEHYAADFRPV